LDRLETPLLRHREIEGYPAKDIKTLLRQGVLVSAAPAESVAIHAGRSVVVRKTAHGWYGVDEEDAFFSPVPLAEDDVRQYTVSIPAIVDILRRQNDIDGQGYTQEFGLIPVGRRHIDGIGATEVYLSLANYDVDLFASRCRHLQRPSGIIKTILLVPRAVSLSPTVRNAIEAAGVVITPLWRAAQGASLLVDWHALTVAGAVQEVVISPRKIIYREIEYPCDLTAAETAFLIACLAVDEIDVHRIMHAGKTAVIKGRYQRAERQRNRVHKLLSRVNSKLADAKLPVTFSLPRGRDTIVRESQASRADPP
jgi:hypothetical protein